jgi:hypothetical protein
MGRLDTRMAAPPVRIARATATVQQDQMIPADSVPRTARGAGSYGQREARFGSVPIRLRIKTPGGPNTSAALRTTIPIGVTYRKRGYPPIVTLPGAEG